MDKTLLFGAAYYPEYLPAERMDEDIDMMMSAGMNVVVLPNPHGAPLSRRKEFSISPISTVLLRKRRQPE